MMHPLLDDGTRHLDCLDHHLDEFHRFELELDLAARDARHVEQIVDQAHQVMDLALDDLALAPKRIAAAHLHQVERSQNRRERIAQLMPQHREEFIFGAIGAAQCLGGPALFLMGERVGERAGDLIDRQIDEAAIAIVDLEARTQARHQKAVGTILPSAAQWRDDRLVRRLRPASARQRAESLREVGEVNTAAETLGLAERPRSHAVGIEADKLRRARSRVAI